MNRALMNSLLFFPSRSVEEPSPSHLRVENLVIATDDGERLHAWWVAGSAPTLGHVLLSHGNAGNISSRAAYARLLTAAGFDVLLFDYRGYGRSTGRPSEEGTYRDARAARRVLLERNGVRSERIFYLGESLGGAVSVELALEFPPAGVILQSAFTSVRDMARAVYPFIPRALVPDAYPSLRLIRGLRSPLLVLHGEGDEIVPLAHARALHAAAPGPKRIEVVAGTRHNDLLLLAGDRWIDAITSWAEQVVRGDPSPPAERGRGRHPPAQR